MAPAVVRTATDVPLPAVAGDLPLTLADPDRLQQLGDRWRLGSSLSRFVAAVTGQ